MIMRCSYSETSKDFFHSMLTVSDKKCTVTCWTSQQLTSHILVLSVGCQRSRFTCASHFFLRSLLRGKRNIRWPFACELVHSGTQQPVIAAKERFSIRQEQRVYSTVPALASARRPTLLNQYGRQAARSLSKGVSTLEAETRAYRGTLLRSVLFTSASWPRKKITAYPRSDDDEWAKLRRFIGKP